jgi:peptide deformylase
VSSTDPTLALTFVAPYEIRVIGDPVLSQRAAEVDDIDGRVARLVDDMFTTMYDAPGLGLAAPQVGVQKRIFVYDDQDGLAGVLVNPEIRESSGEWEHQEGCLSIPGVYFDIVRPKEILLVGRDLDGNEVQIEADEMVARIFQHELDHLDGVLMVEHLDGDQRRQAKKAVRELQLQRAASRETSASGGLRLP